MAVLGTPFKVENRKKIMAALDTLDDIRAGHQCTWAQLLHHGSFIKSVTTALVGARTANQSIENAKAMTISLSDEEQECCQNILRTQVGYK